jgi:molybdopterin-guanine dinucleotide biosynthesis protein
LRKAGASQTIVASKQRWALMTETPDEPDVHQSLAFLQDVRYFAGKAGSSAQVHA